MKTSDKTRGYLSKRKRGFALIFVLGFAAILAIFTASIGAQAAFNLRTVENRGEADAAYYAASTGTQLSLSLLREPPTGWLETDGVVGVPPQQGEPEVLAHTYHNFPGYGGQTDTADDGTIIPLDHFYIISLGIANGGDGNGGSRFEQTTMGSTVRPTFPTMPQAAFGFDKLHIDGVVDHFDSRVNPSGPITYVPAAAAGPMDCEQLEASVGTHATSVSATAITLGDNARIDGHLLIRADATSGDVTAIATHPEVAGTGYTAVPNANYNFARAGTPEASGSGVSTTGTKLNGMVSRLHTNKIAPSIDPNVELAAKPFPPTGVLEEGNTYIVNGNLSLFAGDSITVVAAPSNTSGNIGDALVLVRGNISFTDNSSINAGNPPRRLKIYSIADPGTDTIFTMNNSEAHCLVSGDSLVATINGNSELWGAVLGREVTLGSAGSDNSAIHYDVALRDPVLIADLYDYVLAGTVFTGATATQVGNPANPTTTTTGGPVAPAPVTTSGCGGCGCGCGCGGSMMLALKAEQELMHAY